MISPKEKVRANIYKQLLEEEKRKRKKMSIMSLSLFVVGIFTGKTIDMFEATSGLSAETLVYETNEKLEKEIQIKIDELFQVDQIKMRKNNFNLDNLFVSELQI